MEKRADMLSTYQKRPKLFDTLFVLASLAFLILVTGKMMLGGGDAYSYFVAITRLLVPFCLFLYIGFFHSLIRFTLLRTSTWLNLLAAVASLSIGFGLVRAFYGDFFSGASGSFLVALVSIALGVLACFFLFFLLLFFLEALLLLIRNLRNEPETDSITPSASIQKRLIIASLFAVASFALCYFTLHKGHEWGADYALYIRQAFQLVKGEVAGISEVWGFSLALSLVYRLIGYDTGDYHTILYYKIPGVLAFAAIAFFLYLFYSKRFSLVWSAFLTALIAFNPFFINFTNNILTDIPYLMWCVIGILCIEQYYSSKTIPKQTIFALLTGVSVFFANFTRAAGMSLIATLLVIDLLFLLSLVFRRSRFLCWISGQTHVHKPLVRLLPYLIYGVLLYASYTIVPYSSNTASLSRYSTVSVLFRNFAYYVRILFNQFPMSISPFKVFQFLVYWIVVPLFLIGILRSAKRELIPLVYFSITYLAMHFVYALAGERYAFPILFIILLFLAYAATFAYRSLYRIFSNRKGFSVLRKLVSGIVVCFLLFSSISNAWGNMAQNRAFNRYAFSSDAIATYRYIQENTPEDALIVFYKSEVIKINTNRASTWAIDPAETRDQYLLITHDGTAEHQYLPDEYPNVESLEQAMGITLVLEYQNPRFLFYRIL